MASLDNILIKSYASECITFFDSSMTDAECFKDDNASQWKRGQFDPRSLRNS